MRNPKRIPEILKELEWLWLCYSDLRFWQVIAYVKHQVSEGDNDFDPYYLEDDETLAAIRQLSAPE